MGNPVIITVGGGKGGVGKSTMVAHLGAVLAARSRSVGLIDLDLGGANLHTCVGVARPTKGLQEFLLGRATSLAEVALQTSLPRTWIVSGSGDGSETANPTYGQKQRLISGIRKVEADFVLLDLGAGSSTVVTDFFCAFPVSIVVSDGSPASLENAYGFLKNGVVRGLCRLFPGREDVHELVQAFSIPAPGKQVPTVAELLDSVGHRFPGEARRMREWLFARKTFLVVNMVRDQGDIARARRLCGIVKKYLSIGFIYIGYVAYANEIRDSFKQTQAPRPDQMPASSRECFDVIARNLLALTQG